MFLTGTILNVITVLLGTGLGLLVGSRMPARMQESLVTGLGFFTLLISVSLGLRLFTDPAAQPGDELAVLGAILVGVALGELLRLHDGLEALGAWFQRRFGRAVREAFTFSARIGTVHPALHAEYRIEHQDLDGDLSALLRST